jgi:hypothetical protein
VGNSFNELSAAPDFDAGAAGVSIAKHPGSLYCGTVISRVDYLGRGEDVIVSVHEVATIKCHR